MWPPAIAVVPPPVGVRSKTVTAAPAARASIAAEAPAAPHPTTITSVPSAARIQAVSRLDLTTSTLVALAKTDHDVRRRRACHRHNHREAVTAFPRLVRAGGDRVARNPLH